MFACSTKTFFRVRWLYRRDLWAGIALLLLSASSFAGSVNLAWDPSTASNLGGYKLYYGTSSRNYATSIDVGNVTSKTISGLTDGATYYFAATAYDTAGNQSSYSNEVSSTVLAAADFTVSATTVGASQTVTFTPSATATVSSWAWNFGDGSPAITGTNSTVPQATKSYPYADKYTVSLTVGGVTKTTVITVTPAAKFTASVTSGTAPLPVTFTDSSTGNPDSWTWNFGDGTTSTAQNPPAHTYGAAGTYTVSLKVAGSGVSSANTATMTINVLAASGSGGSSGGTTSGSTTSIKGLVAAYGFEEGSGTSVVDASGTGNTGTISGATWTTAGRYGKALMFNGTSALVTVKDSASLRLTTAMTLEAWVKPSVVNGIWQDVIYKGNDNYYLEASSTHNGKPGGGGRFGSGGTYGETFGTSALPVSTWTHLALTYDGSALRLYVNGNPVSSVARTGSLATSTNPLQVGGDSLYGQYFQGTIDEVRIYNRALSQAEIKTDSTKSVISSSAAKFLVGDQSIEPNVDYNGQGVAQAFSTVAQASGTVTNLQVYVDSSSTATELVAGIYSNNNGHPGTLLAQGKLSSPVAGKWNQVSISGATISAGRTYWMAILGSQGVLRFRDTTTGQVTTETSASGALTTLPATWATGGVWQGFGAVSVYGVGN